MCVGVVHPPLLQRRYHQRHPPVPQYLPRQRIPPHHALPHTDLFQQSRQGEGDTACTDKKENKIFLIYKEIQMESGEKSYMRKGFLIYEEMQKYFHHI